MKKTDIYNEIFDKFKIGVPGMISNAHNRIVMSYPGEHLGPQYNIYVFDNEEEMKKIY